MSNGSDMAFARPFSEITGSEESVYQQDGMTKRELIAMHIMAGLDGTHFDTKQEMAECAIGRTDALLKELG